MRYFKILIATLLATILTGCQDGALVHHKDTKERVKVALQLAIVEGQNGAKSLASITSGNPSGTEAFNMISLDESKAKSNGTTELFNLWVFQFDAGGNKQVAERVSDNIDFVNDMANLSVSLIPGVNQQIYVVVLGTKIKVSETTLNSIATIDQLENLSFECLKLANGFYESLITSDNEIPYSGVEKGITIQRHGNSGSGEVIFTAPNGFIGGVRIKRLMSKITFRYKYNVENYQQYGISLKNVHPEGSINPDKYDEKFADRVVELNAEKSTTTDAQGYYIHTWYVPQNMKGTVSIISTESDRWNGKAPQNAMVLELVAKNNNEAMRYLKYEMYMGKNSTSNFDIEANHNYNFITEFSLKEDLAKKDNRVTSFILQSGSILCALTGSGSGLYDFMGTFDPFGSRYDFDAHYGSRTLYVQAAGSIAEVEVTSGGEWLKVSPYPNYTDAINNSAIGARASAALLVPNEVKFTLFCDEYLVVGSSREATIKVTIKSNDGGGTKTSTYTVRQNGPINMGRLGGEPNQYGLTKDLLVESIEEYNNYYSHTSTFIVNGLIWGYSDVANSDLDNYSKPSEFDKFEGANQTKLLAENLKGLLVNNNLPTSVVIPQHNGNLYQYDEKNTYSARYCYDKNRDLDGNGVIDYRPDDPSNNELKWYLPAFAQLKGFWIYSANASDDIFATSNIYLSTIRSTNSNIQGMHMQDGIAWGYPRRTATKVRCVRDATPTVPTNASEANVTVEDGYIVIQSDKGMLARGVEKRVENAYKFYHDLPMYSDINTPMGSDEGRIIRHTERGVGVRIDPNNPQQTISAIESYRPNQRVSRKFAIADIDFTGSSFDVYSGYLIYIQNQAMNASVFATNSGCSQYLGKGGDAVGSWRMPTQREMTLIQILNPSIRLTKKNEGLSSFAPFESSSTYYTATEKTNTHAWKVMFNDGSVADLDKKSRAIVRCIKDLE